MINKFKQITSPLNSKHGYIVEIEEIEDKYSGEPKFEARVRHIKFTEDGYEHIKYFSEITNATKGGLIKYLTQTANEHIDGYDKELFIEQYLIVSQFEDMVVEEE